MSIRVELAVLTQNRRYVLLQDQRERKCCGVPSLRLKPSDACLHYLGLERVSLDCQT